MSDSKLQHLESMIVIPNYLDEQHALKGKALCQDFEFLRDLMTVMEHPELRSFFEKYLNRRPKDMLYTLWVMKLYSLMDKKLSKMFPYPEDRYWGWHKIFYLYTFVLRDARLQRFFKREMLEKLPEDWVVVSKTKTIEWSPEENTTT